MIQNEKLRAIITQAAENLPTLVEEGESDLLKAWDSAVEEAQKNEKKPKFKLGFSIVLDLDADHMKTTLSFSTSHSLTADEAIPEPSQPIGDLPEEAA